MLISTSLLFHPDACFMAVRLLQMICIPPLFSQCRLLLHSIQLFIADSFRFIRHRFPFRDRDMLIIARYQKNTHSSFANS